MSLDLSNSVDGTPERFVPDQMHGDLVEAEHLVRYWWASELAAGRRVLDAGCGVGYGTALLARAGATSAVGVDVASAVIEAIPDDDSGATFRQADVRDLLFDDGSFDLVVCFEVIEHVEDQEAIAAELARVLSDDGILLVSSPNPDATVPGNPHHTLELRPEALSVLLARVLEHVRLVRQHDWVASAVVDDAIAPQDGLTTMGGLKASTTIGVEPGQEPYAIALASRVPLPDVGPRLVATGLAEPRRWVEHYAAQQQILHQQKDLLERHRSDADELGELHMQLLRSEAEIARLVEIEARLGEFREHAGARIRELQEQLARTQDENRILTERLGRADRVMEQMQRSPSWRVTAPLRTAKRLTRGGR